MAEQQPKQKRLISSGQDILLTFAMHDGNHDGLVERYV